MAFRNRIVRISQLVVDVLRTAAPPNARWEISSGGLADTIVGYTGAAEETQQGQLQIGDYIFGGGLKQLWTILAGPRMTGGSPNGAAFVVLSDQNIRHVSQATIIADEIRGQRPGGASSYLLDVAVLFKATASGTPALSGSPIALARIINIQGGEDVGGVGWSGSAFTIPIAGYYRIVGAVKSNGSGGVVGAGVTVNGAVRLWSPNGPGGAFQGGTVEGILKLAVNDTVSLIANGTGTAVNDSPAESTMLLIQRIPVLAS